MRVCSYAKQRACIGALETSARPKTYPQEVAGVEQCKLSAPQVRARAKKGPREGQKGPRDTSTVCSDISSETKVRSTHLCKPLRLEYVYPPPMLVRVRDSAIADYAPPTIIVEKHFSKQVHKQAERGVFFFLSSKLSRVNARER